MEARKHAAVAAGRLQQGQLIAAGDHSLEQRQQICGSSSTRRVAHVAAISWSGLSFKK
jgi:hypothetical protein